MRPIVYSIFPLLVVACGQKEVETPYGSMEEVSAYLSQVNPYIQEIGQIHAEYEQGLGTATDPAKRRGTGENLAQAAAVIQPRLRNLLGEFEKVEPPPLLTPFHRDTKQLIVARLEAYAATIKGWETERAAGDFATVYSQAEEEIKKANALIERLNGEMLKINAAVQQAEAGGDQAS